MSILIKRCERYYEIPEDLLNNYEISKEQFEQGVNKIPADYERPLIFATDRCGCTGAGVGDC
ncbi:MAG: hypothetical protein NT010_05405 [Proteobacteria bacterium]|nr:hypothetical protein [Pseudomonadota bacterium]